MKIIVDGVAVQVATGGRSLDGDDPLVVLVHGAGMNRSVWHQQTRYLAFHGYRVVAVDLPGHGGTPGPLLDSVPAMADWSAAVVAALGAPAHLVGHSMGAFIAIETAARYPQCASSVVLLGAAAAMPVHPDLQAAADANDDVADELVAAWSLSHQQHVGHNPTPGFWMAGSTVSLLHTADDDVLSNDLQACSVYLDAPARLADISCRVTIIAGSADRMTPARGAEALAAASPDADYVVIADAGHMAIQEQPDTVRGLLMTHLRSADASVTA